MKIAFVAGTRPNFVKIAPLIEECKRQGLEYYLIHTGQHFDQNMSQVFFKELKIPEPDVNLGINATTPQDLRRETSKKIAEHLLKVKPRAVVVVGDSDATCAGAIAAKQLKIKLAHVEAGLRSFYMAMPEERNRIYIDKVADYLFVTEPSGLRNLKTAKAKGKIFMVGNVMIDSLVSNLAAIKLRKNIFKKNSYTVATLHRKSNVHNLKDLKESINILNYVADTYLNLVLPIHPRTKLNIENSGLTLSKKISLVEPMGYLDFQKLIYDSAFAITDSGGIQDETTFYKIPCITLRTNTERWITFKVGTSVLVGRNKRLIDLNIQKILRGKFKKGRVPKYWDGKSAERIIKILKMEFASYTFHT